MSGFNPRWIIGKTVASVDMRPGPDGRGGTYHTPTIYFTDGSLVWFTTQETEVGEYGTQITYYRPKRKP